MQLPTWTLQSLRDALETSDPSRDGRLTLDHPELGGDATIVAYMPDILDDIPMFITVVETQILVEVFLWPKSAIDPTRVAALNETLLEMQKFFPLSAFALESDEGSDKTYALHGALSADCSLATVLHEIETLADNALGAYELYSEFTRAA